MQTLSPRVRRVVRSVTEAMFNIPEGADPDRMRWYIDDMDEFMVAAGIKTRMALRVALFTLQLSPMLLTFRPRRFTSLSLERRIELLERYELSPMSLLMAAVKLVFSLIYFEHPRTLAEYGLDPRTVWPGVEEAMGIQLGPRQVNPFVARRIASESHLELSAASGSAQVATSNAERQLEASLPSLQGPLETAAPAMGMSLEASIPTVGGVR